MPVPPHQRLAGVEVAAGEEIAITHGDIGIGASEEALQAGSPGKAKVLVEIEEVFERLEQGIVVEGDVGDGAGLQEVGQQNRASAISAVAVERERDARRDVGALREGAEVRARLLVAAKEALSADDDTWTVRIRSDREAAFVEGDDNQTTVLKSGGRFNQRNPFLQEGIAGHESAGLPVLAGTIVAVIAQIGSDEDEVRSAVSAREVGRERRQVDDVLLAIGRVNDGVEIDEGIVARGVLIDGFSGLRMIDSVENRMAASGGFARWIVAHIFHIAAPSLAGSGQLIGESLHACRIHAAVANSRAVGRGAGLHEVGVHLAAIARLGSGGLAADHGDVVVEADVAGAEILIEQDALSRQRLGQEGSLRVRAESGVEALIFQDDDENMAVAVAIVIAVMTAKVLLGSADANGRFRVQSKHSNTIRRTSDRSIR